MPSMAVDTTFSSLPFSPLPPHGRSHAIHRNTSEKGVCGVPLQQSMPKTTVYRVPEREDHEDGPPSWTKLATSCVSFTLHSEGLMKLSAMDTPLEQQWCQLWYPLGADAIEGGELLKHVNGFTAAVQSSPPPKQKQEDPEKQDFYVNVGYAIRTLREELPCMFYKELTYDVYRKDIVFRDPMHMVGGINNYKQIFKALRFYGRIFFKALWVDILRVCQPSDNVIMVRWQVRGVPRVPWESQGIFDGTSEYKLDKQGKIYEHNVDNVALNSRPKFKVPTVLELLRVGTCPSTPKPTFFSKAQHVSMVLWPYLAWFTWVHYYLALKGTVSLCEDT